MAVVVQERVALVAGATGLVGREILADLLADKTYATVHSVGRRLLAQEHPKLVQHVVDFSSLPSLPAVDDCFIALGTTIKIAGSQQAFRAIDLQAVQNVALAARTAGATRAAVVSAMGANAQSSVFYNRVKGEMEHAVAHMGFNSLVIARPSLLDGQRHELKQPPRAAERYMLPIMRGLKLFIPANYRAILAQDVAHAMLHAIKTGTPGVVTLMSGEMQRG